MSNINELLRDQLRINQQIKGKKKPVVRQEMSLALEAEAEKPAKKKRGKKK
jgi:hypothetical protein